jgi:hypothetical protein
MNADARLVPVKVKSFIAYTDQEGLPDRFVGEEAGILHFAKSGN